MATTTSAIRGARVGSGPMGEKDQGFKAERIAVSYFCANNHSHTISYAATSEVAEIPAELDCPNCGLPAGQDIKNPPAVTKHEPFKTHLAYVKERRTNQEANDLLEEAIETIRQRRIQAAAADKD